MKPHIEKKKKKGFLSIVWESMTKTGGCCGSENSDCCGIQQDPKKLQTKDKENHGSSNKS
jgi:hypothetical protein